MTPLDELLRAVDEARHNDDCDIHDNLPCCCRLREIMPAAQCVREWLAEPVLSEREAWDLCDRCGKHGYEFGGGKIKCNHPMVRAVERAVRARCGG